MMRSVTQLPPESLGSACSYCRRPIPVDGGQIAINAVWFWEIAHRTQGSDSAVRRVLDTPG